MHGQTDGEGRSGVGGYRDRIADTWTDTDPLVLAFEGEGMPVVAEVDGELRYLSYNIVRPRRVDEDDLAKFIALRGEPRVLPLSDHPAGYEPRLLRLRAV
ncbi:MAG: hypothetical protein ACQEQY_09220 [Halobacteriota archaeon]